MFYYTYLVYCVPTDQYYYGVRVSAKHKPEDDLWKRYFTSSKIIKSLIKEYGINNFKIEIRHTFKSKRDAYKWEHIVLRRMKVINDNRWINQSTFNNYAIDNEGDFVYEVSDSTKQKMSDHGKKYTKMRDPTGKIRLVLKEDRSRLENDGWLFGTGLKPKHLQAGPNHPCNGRVLTHKEINRIIERNKIVQKGNQNRCRPIRINGVVYASIVKASDALGIKRTTINERLRLRPSIDQHYVGDERFEKKV